MKAYVNEDCIFCGLCADLCPAIFQLGDEQAFVSANEIPEEMWDCCREASEECPTEAIEIFE
ncbi:MAG: ferredoxin [Dethiobacteria bacterium]|jgi:ferredoxin|nr:ferredoxin [Bacillota bacterium]NMD33187.1 ferredoxin [Bacillota bacterium]HOB29199.1 ferredoxin [Bacillota bacterium]HPZ41811.1 ferredoxin [Bacillota bacterium]HQD52680.1 ferredoxin [Bacillota bacterium]